MKVFGRDAETLKGRKLLRPSEGQGKLSLEFAMDTSWTLMLTQDDVAEVYCSTNAATHEFVVPHIEEHNAAESWKGANSETEEEDDIGRESIHWERKMKVKDRKQLGIKRKGPNSCFQTVMSVL